MPRPEVQKFYDEVTALQDRKDAAITQITATEKEQLALIEKLQNTPDGWTPEDQALLDQIQARSKTQVDALEALSTLPDPPTPPA